MEPIGQVVESIYIGVGEPDEKYKSSDEDDQEPESEVKVP